VAERLAASQEGLSSVELVGLYLAIVHAPSGALRSVDATGM
jgi:hypothetical protein